MTLLPSAYLPSVEYFARLLRDDCTIDLGEHFIKRSQRNRTHIMTANGVLALTVHIRNANRPGTPVRDIRIDYSKRWQHIHRTAIESAYRSSAYFDHYGPRILELYDRQFEFLADLNAEMTLRLLELARIERRPAISQTYIDPAEALCDDLRPKKRESSFVCTPYYQLFSDRFEFAGNLSFIDLLFAEGPSAADLLRSCRL